MFDLKWIRECPDEFDRGLARRGLPPTAAPALDLDSRRRKVQTRLQELQTKRNEASKAIGEAKRRGDDAAMQMAEVARVKDDMAAAETEERALADELDGLLAGLPNVPAPEVPDGSDENANVCLRTHGEAPRFDFDAREHYELGEALGMMDFATAAKLSGARFVVMRKAIARLHRALSQFMIDMHTDEHGYTETAPPYLVRDHVLYGTGQLPKFGDDLFRTTDDFWLIPTAEVPLTNLVAGEMLAESDLPKRFAAMTWCFRSEAGAAGKDTRGMIRQHQFTKVEMVSVVQIGRAHV